MKTSILTIVLFLGINIVSVKAQNLTEKANAFLNSLSSDLRESAQFTFEDKERFNMVYVPAKRKGPTFNDFNAEQTEAAVALLKASLSDIGFKKSSDIRTLEDILYKIENNNPGRDSKDYHFLIFGTPTQDEPWGWKFEGHHQSLNFSAHQNKIVSSTPSFMGTNPAIADVEGFDKKDVLKKERDLGFSLISSMDAEQLKVTRYSDIAPRDIITGTARKVEQIEPRGIYYTALTDKQQGIFMNLLNTYINNYELGFAETLRNKIKRAGIENLSFAWAGSLTPGEGHYYRIQGPMLLIEYDNTQNDANHIHAIVRDLTNDYAEDILKRHYEQEH